MMPPILRTQRLVLRPLAPGDSDAVHAIMSDDEAMRFWDWPAFKDHGVVAGIVEGQIADMEDGRSAYWAVTLGGEVIGACDLSEIDLRQRRAETGFLFNRAWWGNGYAAEAMGAVCTYAFESLCLDRLWARLHSGNEGSRRLLERLGFAYEGTLVGHVLRDGSRRDCLIYGRLADSACMDS